MWKALLWGLLCAVPTPLPERGGEDVLPSPEQGRAGFKRGFWVEALGFGGHRDEVRLCLV